MEGRSTPREILKSQGKLDKDVVARLDRHVAEQQTDDRLRAVAVGARGSERHRAVAGLIAVVAAGRNRERRAAHYDPSTVTLRFVLSKGVAIALSAVHPNFRIRNTIWRFST